MFAKSTFHRSPLVPDQSSAERMPQQIGSLVFYHQFHGMCFINLIEITIIIFYLKVIEILFYCIKTLLVLLTHHKFWLAFVGGKKKVIKELIVNLNLIKYEKNLRHESFNYL